MPDLYNNCSSSSLNAEDLMIAPRKANNTMDPDPDLSGQTAHTFEDEEASNSSATTTDGEFGYTSSVAVSEDETPTGEIAAPIQVDIFQVAQQFAARRRGHKHQLLVLISLYGEANNREAMTQQNRTLTILQGALGDTMEEPFLLVDASDPKHHPQRDALLEVSGKGPVYPQFFLVQRKQQELSEHYTSLDDLYQSIQFFGDYNDLFTANERQTLRSSFLAKKPLVREPSESVLGGDEAEEEEEKALELVNQAVEQESDSTTSEAKDNESPQEVQPEQEDESKEESSQAQVRGSWSPPQMEEESTPDTTGQARSSWTPPKLEEESTPEEAFPQPSPTTEQEETEDEREARKRRASEAWVARIMAQQKQAQEEMEAMKREQKEQPPAKEEENELEDEKEARRRRASEAWVARIMAQQKQAQEEANATTSAKEEPMPVGEEENESEDDKEARKRRASEAWIARIMAQQKQAQEEAEAMKRDPVPVEEEEEGEAAVTRSSDAATLEEENNMEDQHAEDTLVANNESNQQEPSTAEEEADTPLTPPADKNSRIKKTKPAKKLKENALCWLPDWVETYMILPTNPVVSMEESWSMRKVDNTVFTTSEVTLFLRNGEEQKQRNTTFKDLLDASEWPSREHNGVL